MAVSNDQEPAAPVDASGAEPSESAEPVVVLPPQPPMPAFSSRFSSMQHFYRFHFVADGYPGRAEPDGTVYEHPIYGSYILGDYLRQYEKDATSELRDAIATVARASLSRMSEHHDALVYWYDAKPGQGARLYDRHYSGLTQGYYAIELMRAAKVLSDPELEQRARRVFSSLLVPADKGGVFYDSPVGPTIAEVPQWPNSWILNGWQSALVSIEKYARLSGDPVADEVVHESARAMGRMLPHYDEPSIMNSRYGLTGYAYLRLRFSTTPESLTDLALHVPTEPPLPVLAEGASRWQTYVLPEDMDLGRPAGRAVRLNAVLSLASRPEENRLAFTATLAESGELILEGMRGRYDPRRSAPTGLEWTELGRRPLPAGSSSVDLPIPDDFVAATAYPTNFVKKIDGMNVNIYHGIHVRRLREIEKISGVRELGQWADRWAGYIDQWPTMELYSGLAMRSFKNGAVTPLEDWPSVRAP